MDRKGSGEEIQGGDGGGETFQDPQHIERGMDEKKKMILEIMRIHSGKDIFTEDLFGFEGKNDAAIWRESIEAHVLATVTTTTGEVRDEPASPLMCNIPRIVCEATGGGSGSDHSKKYTGTVVMDGGNSAPMRK